MYAPHEVLYVGDAEVAWSAFLASAQARASTLRCKRDQASAASAL